MNKNLFVKKDNKKIYYIILLFLIFLLYLISYFFFINQKYFIISNSDQKIFYIIPKDKEGEKVKYINKKSINNLSLLDENNQNQDNINDLVYTIQLYSDTDYQNIQNYIKKLLELKSEILSEDDLFIFSVNSQIGIDYFLTYKNFDLKIEALTYCKKLSFVKKCLILNPQN